jgi:Zn-finger nucleic acid-binding protein
MTERNNIEIDYCPACRGVWLDKGELDKMLEYADQYTLPSPSEPRHEHTPVFFGYKNKHAYNQQRPHKKKSFLGDLFDFD